MLNRPFRYITLKITVSYICLYLCNYILFLLPYFISNKIKKLKKLLMASALISSYLRSVDWFVSRGGNTHFRTLKTMLCCRMMLLI